MSLSRKIENTANVATIVVAALLSAVLIRTFLLPRTVAPNAVAVTASEVTKGKSMDGRALGVDWTKNRRTLEDRQTDSCSHERILHFASRQRCKHTRAG
jgi:hypothetical protein